MKNIPPAPFKGGDAMERCDGQYRRALGWEDVTERCDGQYRRALRRGDVIVSIDEH